MRLRGERWHSALDGRLAVVRGSAKPTWEYEAELRRDARDVGRRRNSRDSHGKLIHTAVYQVLEKREPRRVSRSFDFDRIIIIDDSYVIRSRRLNARRPSGRCCTQLMMGLLARRALVRERCERNNKREESPEHLPLFQFLATLPLS